MAETPRPALHHIYVPERKKTRPSQWPTTPLRSRKRTSTSPRFFYRHYPESGHNRVPTCPRVAPGPSSQLLAHATGRPYAVLSKFQISMDRPLTLITNPPPKQERITWWKTSGKKCRWRCMKRRARRLIARYEFSSFLSFGTIDGE